MNGDLDSETARILSEYLKDTPGPRGWKPEVYIPQEGKWHGNGLVFATEEEAARWARDLLGRWFIPSDSRAVPTTDEPNYRLRGDGKIELLGGPQDGAIVEGAS